jgi:hypothetical protein
MTLPAILGVLQFDKLDRICEGRSSHTAEKALARVNITGISSRATGLAALEWGSDGVSPDIVIMAVSPWLLQSRS